MEKARERGRTEERGVGLKGRRGKDCERERSRYKCRRRKKR